MTTTHTVLCGGVRPGDAAGGQGVVVLDRFGPDANVHLKISDISEAMARDVPGPMQDLLDVAAYVFAADQAVGRGGRRETGELWRRRLSFHIPLRSPDLWSRRDVTESLIDALSFVSDDDYSFTFSSLDRAEPSQLYFENLVSDLAADEVVLFSGGIDSLGGAVEALIGRRRRVALVSHRSSPKRVPALEYLAGDLNRRVAGRVHHIPIWATKAEDVGREYTQRTRSFLYASLAAVVARMLGLSKIHFCENGVTSLNLPIAPQLVGGRASRTTHPQALNGLARFLSLLFQQPFAVESPFLWLTKADVVRLIKQHGCADLIRHTVSCSRTIEATKVETHCGRCSQCIDRRFGTLAAGLSADEDPAEMYAVQLLTDPRVVGETRTMAEAFMRRALALRSIDELELLKTYPEATRVLRHVGLPTDVATRRIHDLHRRHGDEVHSALVAGHRQHAAEFQAGTLPDSCILVLAVPDRYLHRDTAQRVPAFRRSAAHWNIWFENEEATLNDGVGPRYLALLLANPGQRAHVIDMQLAEAVYSGRLRPAAHAGDAGEAGHRVRRSPSSSGGDAADRIAIREYRVRLDQIDGELAQVEMRDPARAVELKEEADAVRQHMAAVVDLRGRLRPTADDDERARNSVGKALSRTLNVLWRRHPALARHLGRHLETGIFCVYKPDPTVAWQI